MNLKRGAIRDDGYRLNGYTSNGKEHWLHPDVYARRYRTTMSQEEREKDNAKSRLWYSKNTEKAKASTQKWRIKNKDKIRAHKTAWLKKPENRIKNILGQASRRAADKGMEFNITIEDLLPLPIVCPVFNIPINYQGTGAKGFVNDSPSIDRIDSSIGYVKGNVQIISWRANRIKFDATLDELEKLLFYMKR